MEALTTIFDWPFTSVFGSSDAIVGSVTLGSFLICCITSIVLGLACAGIYMYKNDYSKSFIIGLSLLPLVIQVVIMLVNGNVGAGIAVLGAFSLLRFRSDSMSIQNMLLLFLAMAIGLATGMGFLALAILFVIIFAIASFIFRSFSFGISDQQKTLEITIPEDLQYDGVFDPVLNHFTNQHKLVSVQTTNMGSLFKLKFNITMKKGQSEKALIDRLRCLNGNLKISLGEMPNQRD